jgi:hypothetical protein
VTGRYWVRLKDHLNAEMIKSLSGVLSSYALSLKQGPADREFTVELMPKKAPEDFERTVNVWVGAGFVDWRKLNSNP